MSSKYSSKSSIVAGHLLVAQAEQPPHEPVVLPQRVALVAVQVADVEAVDQVGRLEQRRERPEQVLRIVGGVRGPGGEPAHPLGQLATDLRMHAPHARGLLVGVGAAAEVDRRHDGRRAPEPGVRIVEPAGAVVEALEHDGMRGLQQQRAGAGERDDQLAVDAADRRVVLEVALAGCGGAKRIGLGCRAASIRIARLRVSTLKRPCPPPHTQGRSASASSTAGSATRPASGTCSTRRSTSRA